MFWKKWFSKPSPPPAIVPGQKWQRAPDDSPWPDPVDIATILEVKNGWVRYTVGRPQDIFYIRKMEEFSFRYCYRKMEDK